MDSQKDIKARCLAEMREYLATNTEQLARIEPRVAEYAMDCVREDTDVHCLDELLCLRRFIRFCNTYDVDAEHVQAIVQDAEGVWKDGHHVQGGFEIDGIYGYKHYRLTMSQVYILAYIYGFKAWTDTRSPIGSREMMPTEREGKTGTIEDYRRLIRSYIAMIPRKYAKTWLSAFVQFEGIMGEERDYEGYVAANGADQSQLVFSQLKNFLRQVDPSGEYFRFTQTEINWLPSTGRAGKVVALTAGGKTKDGLKASCCSADEFGAAQRVKEHCDMEGLINVIQGSMGPRREPLTVHTSTAGLGNDTPYELLVRSFQRELTSEMDIPMDGQPHPMPNDWQAGILLHPDEWELDDESLRTDRVIRKCNPHLGITIQADYYDNEWKAADMQGELKRKEVVTKLYNIFTSSKVTDWIKADEIRVLQEDRRIDDCNGEEWLVFCGMDFSMGNDLHAVSYLAYNTDTGEFFADMDAWITDGGLDTPFRSIYEKWIADGWLHHCPGDTLDPLLPVNRIMQLYEGNVRFMGFGYDSYKAKTPINALAAWVVEVTGSPQAAKDIIVPVSQTYASYNPVVEEMDYLIKSRPSLIHFSNNPMWPWEFQNSVLDVDQRYDNKKPIKRGLYEKIDNIQCLLTALMQYDRADGRENRE